MSRRLLPLLLFFTTLSAFGDDAALFTLYKTRVAPIIQGTCIGCHVSGGAAEFNQACLCFWLVNLGSAGKLRPGAVLH